jgi:hypothetical protein
MRFSIAAHGLSGRAGGAGTGVVRQAGRGTAYAIDAATAAQSNT